LLEQFSLRSSRQVLPRDCATLLDLQQQFRKGIPLIALITLFFADSGLSHESQASRSSRHSGFSQWLRISGGLV
jgi:hypothetical protein